MTIKLLTEHNLEFLSLKGGCRGSSESTHVNILNGRKSHVAAHIIHLHRGAIKRDLITVMKQRKGS